MNKNICQKCFNNVRTFEIAAISDDYIEFHGYNYKGELVCKCYSNNKTIINNYSQIIIDSIDIGKCCNIPATEILNYKKIIPSKLCPYYMEHELLDWNEK